MNFCQTEHYYITLLFSTLILKTIINNLSENLNIRKNSEGFYMRLKTELMAPGDSVLHHRNILHLKTYVTTNCYLKC